jgi:DNA-binding MurR/RpiR family transcriptional regulator
MPDTPTASFLARIRECIDQLPPTERRLGEFMLDFPGELASYSASELAGLVQVSNATITRFVHRLGYASYDEARRHAREQRSAGSPLFLKAPNPGAPEGLLGAHVQRAQDNLAATFSQLGDAPIEEIAQAMVAARSLSFLGYRNNRSFAGYLRWQLAQLLARTQVIPGPGETLGEYAVDMGPQDLLVVFALRRSPAVAAHFASRAAQAGASVVFVTDMTSHAPPQVRWVLRCQTSAPGPLDSHVAVMLLSELLATRVMALAGAQGRNRLAGVEAAHEALAEWGDAPARPPADR